MFLVSAKELGIHGTEEHRIGFFNLNQKRLFDFLGDTKLTFHKFESNNYFGLSTKQGLVNKANFNTNKRI